ncbi:MAG TPA: triose-phosphate isomerase [Candidatus Hydrogenedens sp.]|nr:triose-phosphate isomerase [Candidatus Hydrogenedens sp.]HOK08114.1 triose-phosphate isomerase [Candidatus Hydrogenedens sp.]HPP57892.1 triose-phosphate isomerase [Candidatus Hydrogenedens sp.]
MKSIIAGNWKMNKKVNESLDLVNKLKPLVEGIDQVKIIVCPPFTSLYAVSQVLKGTNIELGGQNCYLKESGAYTGEIAPQMLLDVGCRWTILGHSERRQYFGETDTLLNQKLKYVITTGLNVMFCVGETLDEREGNMMESVLRRQIIEGLRDMTPEQLQNVVIAYEPVWAIGTGKTATPEQAQEAHAFIRSLIGKEFGKETATNIVIQYGGSVKPENAKELISKPDVNGFLVGGASLNAESFAQIIKECI